MMGFLKVGGRIVSAVRRWGRAPHFRIPRLWALLLAILLMGPWFALAVGAGVRYLRGSAVPPREAGGSGRLAAPQPGPWGDLEVLRIVTEPPEDLAVACLRQESGTWFFRDLTREQLTALLKSAGLTDSQRDRLCASATGAADINGIVLHPDANAVREMSPEARAVVYSVLAKDPLNTAQNEPSRCPIARSSEWLVSEDVSAETKSLARRLCYPVGKALLFSDTRLVLNTLPTAAQRIEALKMLARQPTLLVKVRIRRNSNIAALAEYWGQGNRRKDVEPILKSLTRVPGGASLDVVHLLPSLPRKLLYTYPAQPQTAGAPRRDCHWTSLNFWNDPPDDRLVDAAYAVGVLLTAYDRVQGPYSFGDVIVLMQDDGVAAHSAVYLADDIVFTKNGRGLTSPWLLMGLADVQAYYERDSPVTVRAYRKKG